MRKLRRLEDRPGLLRDLRELLAKRVGAPVEPRPVSVWRRVWEWLRGLRT
jgi:hypothetical protein